MQTYGIKLDELKRKIDEIEKKTALQPVFNHYRATREAVGYTEKHRLTYRFIVASDCCLSFRLEIIADFEKQGSSEALAATVEIDGAVAFGKTINAVDTLSFISNLKKGEKTVTVNISGQSAFAIKRATIETDGCVGYMSDEYFLSVINESEKSVVCFCAEGEIIVKKYSAGLLETLLQLADAKCGNIFRLGRYYGIAYADHNGKLKTKLYDHVDFSYRKGCTLDIGVTSACAVSGNPAKIFGVKGRRIYEYSLNDNLDLITRPTEHTAWRVGSDPSVPDYIIATEHSGKSKIIKTE